MSTAANFPVAACKPLNFRSQKPLLFLVRKILAQRLIAEINLYGAISRIGLPEMDHWLCSTICVLSPLKQKKKSFGSALSLKSHRFLNSSKKMGDKGQQGEAWTWNPAGGAASLSLPCKAGDVPGLLLKCLVSRRTSANLLAGSDCSCFQPQNLWTWVDLAAKA